MVLFTTMWRRDWCLVILEATLALFGGAIPFPPGPQTTGSLFLLTYQIPLELHIEDTSLLSNPAVEHLHFNRINRPKLRHEAREWEVLVDRSEWEAFASYRIHNQIQHLGIWRKKLLRTAQCHFRYFCSFCLSPQGTHSILCGLEQLYCFLTVVTCRMIAAFVY